MWVWTIAAPVGSMLMILTLALLEERVVMPVDRAQRIAKALEGSVPDEVEGTVARMLADVAPRRVS